MILHDFSRAAVFCALLLLFIVTPVFALDWDNRVKFIENGTYGTIEIKNSNLLIFEGDTLGSYTLTENTDLCGELCWAIGYASLESSDYLFRGTKAYDLTQSYEKEATFKYYIEELVNKTFEQVIKGTEDCSTITLSDGEKHEVCSGGKTEKVIKEVPEWKEIDISKEKVAGKFKWKIEGRKGALDSVDWVAEAFGKELKAWATWESSLTVGLVEYFDFETFIQSSPYNITLASISSVNSLLHNGTNIVNTTGKYGSGISINEFSPYLSMLNVNGSGSTQDGIFGETAMRNNFTMSFWIYQRNLSSSQAYFFAPASSEVHFLIEAPSYIEMNIRNASTNYLVYTNGAVGNWSGNRWNNLVYTYSTSNGYSIYVNGTKRATRSVQYPNAVATWKTAFGRRSDNTGNFMFNGTFDEIALWNRTLSDAEILSLYDGGTGTFYRTTSDASPTITLNTPTPYQNFTKRDVIFNCTADDNQRIENITINLNGVNLTTEVYASGNRTSINYPYLITANGIYNWTCYAYDNASAMTTGTLRYFNVTDSAPRVGIITTPCTGDWGCLVNSTNVSIYCGAEDNWRVMNISALVNGVIDRTEVFAVATNNTGFTYNKTITNGNYNFSCRAYDNVSQVSAFSSNPVDGIYTYFAVDNVAPVPVITYPADGIVYNTTPTTLNYSVTETNKSKCWYGNGTNNYTINCSLTNWSIVTYNDSNVITLWANDTFGNLNSTTTTFYVNQFRTSVEYQTGVPKEQNITFYFNLTANNITQSNATLIYNGVNYIMNIQSYNDTFVRYNRTITTPSVVVNTDFNFLINYFLNDVSYNSSQYTQSVYTISGLTVSSTCNPKALTFNFYDEEVLNSLKQDISYVFQYGVANATEVAVYGNLTQTNNFSVCINTTISPYFNLGYSEIEYTNTSGGYSDRRYYLYNSTVLNSTTQVHSVYNLLSAKQTSFKLEAEDTSLTPYSDKFASLIRWYPNLNTYKVVDMGKTDETGSTVIHVKTEDVDYRIGLYERDGTLIKLADPIRMVCLLSPCTYTLQVSPTETDYTSFLSINQDLDYNETTGIWTYIYSDSSQKTSKMNLTIYKLLSGSKISICSSENTGSSGAITCNTSAFITSSMLGEVKRSASPSVPIIQLLFEPIESAFANTWILWLATLIVIPLIMIFAVISPVAAVVGGVIALIPAYFMSSISLSILAGFAVLAGIVIHFMKRIG